MALTLESRHVGDVNVVTCRGRLVGGEESAALEKCVAGLLPHRPHIVLDLSDLQFIDSSGLGLLVRCLARARSAHGGLKLCAVSPKIGEVLRVTRLASSFDSYESADDAIAAFYRNEKTDAVPQLMPSDILVVDRSPDVQAYVRELLRQAGFGVTATGNLPDGLTLLRAVQPRVVVIGADLRATRVGGAAEKFNRLADELVVVELPPTFSAREAGDAGNDLLDQVRTAMGSR